MFFLSKGEYDDFFLSSVAIFSFIIPTSQLLTENISLGCIAKAVKNYEEINELENENTNQRSKSLGCFSDDCILLFPGVGKGKRRK